MRRYFVGCFAGLLTIIGLLGVSQTSLAQRGKWITRADMPTPRWGHSTAVVDGKIYVIGGWGRGLVPHIDVYDPQTEAWTKGAGIPTPRASLSTSAVEGKFMLSPASSGKAQLL